MVIDLIGCDCGAPLPSHNCGKIHKTICHWCYTEIGKTREESEEANERRLEKLSQ